MSYRKGYDSWDNISYYCIDTITESRTHKTIQVSAHSYTHVANEYIKTDKGHIISLSDNSQYDSIYPNIFESIVSRDGEYYISGVCVQLDDFDFGYNVKSARKN
jgi:hypothetical protein